MTGIVVRPGCAEDRLAALMVHRLANDSRRTGAAHTREQDARILNWMGDSDSIFVVAQSGGAVVGRALAMQGLADDGAGPPVPGVCFLAMVYVAPPCWGRGVGARLVEARSRGYERIELWTQLDNLRAQRLYEGLELSRTGREKTNDARERIVLYARPLERTRHHGTPQG